MRVVFHGHALGSMFDLERSHDLLVTRALAQEVTAALPGWRVFALGADLPAEAAPLAGVVAARDDLADLEAAGFAGLPVVRMADPGSLSRDLADLLADKLHEARRDAAEARRAAALLRRENEEQSRRMRLLENFTQVLGGPRHLKALDWAPTRFLLELDGAATQRLPLNQVALAAIDLWLPDAAPEDAEEMAIEVLDADGQIVARLEAERPSGGGWRGWARFSAPRPLAGPACDLVIRVVAPPDRSVALGLAAPAPDPRFAVHVEGSAVGDAPLAARVWRSDYLATLPRARGEGGGAAASPRRISLADLGTPEILFTPPLARDYVAADYWAREDALLLHPSAEGPVCAILRDVDVAPVSGISALVHVAHAHAPVLGFAVGVCPRGRATRETWREHIGPYVFLPPGGWGECHCLAAVPRTRCDILLSTMVAGTGTNHNAWALFHDLRLGACAA